MKTYEGIQLQAIELSLGESINNKDVRNPEQLTRVLNEMIRNAKTVVK